MRLRELLVRPWLPWLRAAEKAGAIVLSVAEVAVLLPPFRWGVHGLRAAARFGERVATPARGLAVVAFAAAITLAASQFTDYRAVEIGAPSYTGVETVAPSPGHGPALAPLSAWRDGARDRDRGLRRDRPRGRRQVAPSPPFGRARGRR